MTIVNELLIKLLLLNYWHMMLFEMKSPNPIPPPLMLFGLKVINS